MGPSGLSLLQCDFNVTTAIDLYIRTTMNALCIMYINIAECTTYNWRPTMNEVSMLMTLAVCMRRAIQLKRRGAKEDVIVTSHNTHSCTERPAVNSPATHGPVWWKGSLGGGLVTPSVIVFALSQLVLLLLCCIHVWPQQSIHSFPCDH